MSEPSPDASDENQDAPDETLTEEVVTAGGLTHDLTGYSASVTFEASEDGDTVTISGPITGMVVSTTGRGPPYRGVDVEADGERYRVLPTIGHVSRPRDRAGYTTVGTDANLNLRSPATDTES